MKKYLVIIPFLCLLLSCEDNSTEPTIDKNPLKGVNNLSHYFVDLVVNDSFGLDKREFNQFVDTLLKFGNTYLFKFKTPTGNYFYKFKYADIQLSFSNDWRKIDTLRYYYRHDNRTNPYSVSHDTSSFTILNLDYKFSNDTLTILSADSLNNSICYEFHEGYYQYYQEGKQFPGRVNFYYKSLKKEQVRKFTFNMQLVFAKQ